MIDHGKISACQPRRSLTPLQPPECEIRPASKQFCHHLARATGAEQHQHRRGARLQNLANPRETGFRSVTQFSGAKFEKTPSNNCAPLARCSAAKFSISSAAVPQPAHPKAPISICATTPWRGEASVRHTSKPRSARKAASSPVPPPSSRILPAAGNTRIKRGAHGSPLRRHASPCAEARIEFRCDCVECKRRAAQSCSIILSPHSTGAASGETPVRTEFLRRNENKFCSRMKADLHTIPFKPDRTWLHWELARITGGRHAVRNKRLPNGALGRDTRRLKSRSSSR